MSSSGLIQNLYLVAHDGALCVVGIVTCIEFFVAELEHGIETVLLGLTSAVDERLKLSI